MLQCYPQMPPELLGGAGQAGACAFAKTTCGTFVWPACGGDAAAIRLHLTPNLVSKCYPTEQLATDYEGLREVSISVQSLAIFRACAKAF